MIDCSADLVSRPRKACPVVLRRTADRIEILAFRHPLAGCQLVKGTIEVEETIQHAAERELHEETGVEGGKLQEFGTFGDPGRDPRGWSVTVAYFTLLAWERFHTRAADDAAEVKWFPVKKLPRLAFDHKVIINSAIRALGRDSPRMR